MPVYNKITPEIAEQFKAIVGPDRFFMGEDIDPSYCHDECPSTARSSPMPSQKL